MTFYESQRWHSGEKRGFRLNVRRVAAAAAFASAEHFQSENALILFMNVSRVLCVISRRSKNNWKMSLHRNRRMSAMRVTMMSSRSMAGAAPEKPLSCFGPEFAQKTRQFWLFGRSAWQSLRA
ncbi:hypothetical protein [Desulfovibrio sp. ZJ200]|uniref:hypothetical protein n=1 Tax=Desulfovibrio sp. ZJ200 TaxID=2709792 RepID=UPI0013ED36E1|nr:hypothetical protein [Desulfovibrio sp. ZJ200]